MRMPCSAKTEWVKTREVPSKRHTQGACSHIYVKGTRDIVLSRDYNLTPQLIVLFKRGSVRLPEYVCSSGMKVHGGQKILSMKHLLCLCSVPDQLYGMYMFW